jgi:hypothetical protein
MNVIEDAIRHDLANAPLPPPVEHLRRRTRRRRARRVVAGLAPIVVIVCVATIVIGSSRHTASVNVRPISPTGTTMAACESSPVDAADFVAQVHQQGHTALQSRPLNVTGNGTYVLVFGPLTARDNARYGEAQKGSGFSFPNVSDAFSLRFDRDRMTKVTVEGTTFVHIPATVTDFKTSCAGLRAWLQY